MDNKKYQNAIDYTISVLTADINYNGELNQKHIIYSNEVIQQEGPYVQILPSGFFTDVIYGTRKSLPSVPLKNLCDVPLLYGSPEIQREGNRLVVHADIVASAYFLLTRYEEIVRPDVRDHYGRFPGKQSLPYSAGFINRPVVDEYALLLRKWLREVGLDVPEPKRNFSILLTHDVDHLRKYKKLSQAFRTSTAALLGKRPRRDIFEGFHALIKFTKDPYNTFAEIIELDESSKVNSKDASVKTAYFFMAGDKNQIDVSYDVHSKEAKSVIARVHESGAMIGLHASQATKSHPELIAKEKATLEEVCGFPIRYNRYHDMAWREIEDGWTMVKAGFDWDSTLGYADVAGFRLGVCRPIPLFDPIRMQAFGIKEHPLMVMDVTLSSSSYMNLSEDEAFHCCNRLIDQTRKYKGEFVMLWHNNRLANELSNYHPRLYRRLLNELAYSNLDKVIESE